MNIRVFSAFLQDRRAIVTIAEFKASSGECGGIRFRPTSMVPIKAAPAGP